MDHSIGDHLLDTYTIQLDKDEYRDVAMLAYATYQFKGTILSFILSAVALAIGYIFCSLFIADFNFKSAIYFSGGVSVLFFLLQILFSAKENNYPDESCVMLNPTTFHFKEDSFSITIENSSHTIMYWKDVHKISMDMNFIEIYIDPVAAYYLPIRQIGKTTNPHKLFTHLRGVWRRAKKEKEVSLDAPPSS